MNNKNCAPLVSVYVATYNQEKYLRDCLEGIVMQKTNFPFEALIIDDCSSDSNPEIIREYARRYPDIIRPFLLKENYFSQGKSKIYDVFFPNAKGKYIAFCEGDDYWTYDGKLQAQVDFLEAHPDYSMCCHNYKYLNETGTITNYSHTILTKNHEITLSEIIFENIIQTATVVSRIDFLKDDKYLKSDIDNKLFVHTDTRFFLAYINAGHVFGFKSVWSVYRANPSGITTKNRDILNQITDRTIKQLCNCYNSKYSQISAFNLIRQKINNWINLRRERKYLSAIYVLIKAASSEPIYFITLYRNRYITKWKKHVIEC